MAEKGIKVEDADAGEIVACRDAVALEGADSRIIQLMDSAARTVVFQTTTEQRSVSVSDPLDIDPLPSAMSAGILETGDASHVLVWGKVSNPNTTESGSSDIVVTPVFVSDDATPVAVALGTPFKLRSVNPNSTASGVANAIKTAVNTPLLVCVSFPTHGAKKVAFHVTFVGNNSTFSALLYAAPVSQVGRNGAIDTDFESDAYGDGKIHGQGSL